ncbi:MAG: hypothetical protein PHG39_08765 [Acidithiobacillus ferrooxidans]|uniref:Uncharacterized protein n=1 Tax=Acidithiobacillus ferruginosus TaxID=3063951 RepID=A0ACD5IGG2_9PROT|nr:hypothetical protein [Acidithiobacillus ferruginosus]MDD2747628.1 hypothetical protein [Acidithiobacillus ferrooxidans]MDD5004675.1 hypothetical protein [Acidithiobacillus sp.]MDD5378215.1 hypothetical protein [Acidithiobacillus sp.]
MIPAKGDPENSGNVPAAVELRYIDHAGDVRACYSLFGCLLGIEVLALQLLNNPRMTALS